MVRMNKLMFRALLSAGVVSAASGDPNSGISVADLLGKDCVQLFDELKTGRACEAALKRSMEILPRIRRRSAINNLLYLMEELNFLCAFWEWFDKVIPRELDIKMALSEDVSGDQNLKNREYLLFLRDVKWGNREVREANGDQGKKFGDLESAYKKSD